MLMAGTWYPKEPVARAVALSAMIPHLELIVLLFTPESPIQYLGCGDILPSPI